MKKILNFLIPAFLMVGAVGMSVGGNVNTAKAEGTGAAWSDFAANWGKTDANVSVAGGKNQACMLQTNAVNYSTKANQWSRVTYKTPLKLSDNGLTTPFVSFTPMAQGSSYYDFEVAIFTLANNFDLSKATEAVSVALLIGNPNSNLTNNWCYAAKGISATQTTKQRFSAYAAANNDTDGAAGIMYWNGFLNGEYLTNSWPDKKVGYTGTIGLYYDVETKSVWTDDYWDKVGTRIADGYRAKAGSSSSWNRVLIRDLRHDNSWAPSGGKKGCYGSGFGDAFNTTLDTAYLSITTIRSISNYVDAFGDTMPLTATQTAFKNNRTAEGSGNGSKILVRALDGVSTESSGTSGNMTNVTEPYTYSIADPTYADGVVTVGDVTAKDLFTKSVDAGVKAIQVLDKDDQEVTMASAKTFAVTASPTYTIKYFSDAEKTALIGSKTIDVRSQVLAEKVTTASVNFKFKYQQDGESVTVTSITSTAMSYALTMSKDEYAMYAGYTFKMRLQLGEQTADLALAEPVESGDNVTFKVMVNIPAANRGDILVAKLVAIQDTTVVAAGEASGSFLAYAQDLLDNHRAELSAPQIAALEYMLA